MKILKELLDRITRVRVGVIGDFCLDVYWEQDCSASEKSVETGLPTHPIRTQRYELGGAGNIVSNLMAMGVGTVKAFGVTGEDPFGREMRRLFEAKNVEYTGMLVQTKNWDTFVYLKPIRQGKEDNRIDFGNFNLLSEETASALLGHLDTALSSLDVVIINQQVIRGIHSEFFQCSLSALLERHTDRTFIFDSRHIAGVYPHCLRKLNEIEAMKLSGDSRDYGDVVTHDEARSSAQRLFARWRKPVFVSRGARGVLVADETGIRDVPALHIINPTDPVGAGDSMLAGIAATLAAGHSPLDAAIFGNFVAGVTVQKLFQTGTASPSEILAIGADPDYVYEPELADDPRRAQFQPGTEIEVVTALPGRLKITHAICDHDGTISTLRQGWESVMEPMMIKAILGERYSTADESLYAKATRRVRDYIDKTTGIQTLVQMQGLVKLVREFRGEPLEASRYKEIYLEALMELVRDRLHKLRRQELDVADFTVKKAPHFFQALHRAGIKLHLASGTDEQDVIAEAEALGYASLFEGRIYGAVGDVTVETKRIVLDRIMKDIGEANVSRIVTFGDGPVEIRETRKRGGLAVGIASDEIRRYGLNLGKRSRLIRAGAHLIVPDYSQTEALLACLNLMERP